MVSIRAFPSRLPRLGPMTSNLLSSKNIRRILRTPVRPQPPTLSPIALMFQRTAEACRRASKIASAYTTADTSESSTGTEDKT